MPEEEKMSVGCWYCDVSVLSDPDLFQQGLAELPWEGRREKVMRFRFEKDRNLCLGAGLLAAHVLSQAGASDLTMKFGANGKPALEMYPDIHFSISHSGTLAVCAVSDHPVGVDAERIERVRPGIAERFFLAGELQWMESSPDPERAFYRLWTRKESFLKRLGTGLARPLNSFSVIPGEPAEEGVCFAEQEIAGHLICVCVSQGEQVRFGEWRLFARGAGAL